MDQAEGNLCYLCEGIDYDELFNKPVIDDDHDHHLHEALPRHTLGLGSLAELQARSEHCEVCAFFIEAWFYADLPTQREVTEQDQVQLRRWRARHNPTGWNDFIGVGMRGVTAGCGRLEITGAGPNGVVIAFDPHVSSRFKSQGRFRTFSSQELRDPRANLGLVQSWLRSCEAHHTQRCSITASQTQKEERRLDSLKLIDVQSLQVAEHSPATRYFALSYVWGQAGYLLGPGEKPSTVEREGRRYVPEDAPQVVKDAIRVVKQLGEKYLWMDSYCIDQNNPGEKSQLIGKMDLVYEGATATICVVSDRDAPPGIYGVSLDMSKRHQVVRDCTQGTFKTVTIPRCTQEISRSPWNRRAWTMEEAVLSRRCILFSRTQTVLWCKSHVFHDAFHWSEIPVSTRMPNAYGVTAGSLPFTFDIGGENAQWNFETWSRVLDVYTGRRLTKDRDAMRALAGLRNRLARNTSTALPFGIALGNNICSLLWKIRYGKECTRRNQADNIFPSWSWLGWRTHVEYDHWITPSSVAERRYALEIPRRQSSFWGQREFGLDLVYLEFEARVIAAPIDVNTDTAPPFDDVHMLLRLESQSAFFEIRRAKVEPSWRTVEENGSEIWRLVDAEGSDVPIIKGYNLTGTENLHLVLPKEVSNLDPERMEFIAIQHWKEARPGTDVAPQRFGEVVTTIAIVRDGDKATRVGSVAIPYRSWKNAEPRMLVVDIG